MHADVLLSWPLESDAKFLRYPTAGNPRPCPDCGRTILAGPDDESAATTTHLCVDCLARRCDQEGDQSISSGVSWSEINWDAVQQAEVVIPAETCETCGQTIYLWPPLRFVPSYWSKCCDVCWEPAMAQAKRLAEENRDA